MECESLSFLLGTWRVERRIEDRRLHATGAFLGSSTFQPTASIVATRSPGEVRFEESGLLAFGSFQGRAIRKLHLHQGVGQLVQIVFSDGRPFVDLNLSDSAWRSTHMCGADCYEIRTVVRSSECVEETWRVTGPKKDWEAFAVMTREQ